MSPFCTVVCTLLRLYLTFLLVLQVSVLFRLGFPSLVSSAVSNVFGDLCCAVFIGASVHQDLPYGNTLGPRMQDSVLYDQGK